MILDKYCKWKIAKDIYLVPNSPNLTITKVCSDINIARTSPEFYKLLPELINLGAIELTQKTEGLGNAKLVKINHKILLNVLEDSEVFQEVSEFIKAKNPLFNI